jgi:hypothetical protein
MAINYVDVGIIANDGTGDDLREAFIKVNDNFEELDARIVETTVIENLGTLGQPVYAGKQSGVEKFKRLVAGANITVQANEETITITGSESLDQLQIIVDEGGTIGITRGQTLSLRGGEGIATRSVGQTLYVDLDNSGILVRDSSPTLSANFNANAKDITGANVISANTFQGSLQGLVYGYDLREFGSYFQGFDFGNFRNTWDNAIEFILSQTDVDLGAFTPESLNTIELGSFT